MLWFQENSISTLRFVRSHWDELCSQLGSSLFSRRAMRNWLVPIRIHNINDFFLGKKVFQPFVLLGIIESNFVRGKDLVFFMVGMRNGQFPFGYRILMLWFREKNISTLCFVGSHWVEFHLWRVSNCFSNRDQDMSSSHWDTQY